jgi:hypothetical protein
MIEMLPLSTEKALAFKFSGRITAEDYGVLVPKIDEALATFGSVNILIVMDKFKWRGGLEGAKADFEFGTQQYRQVEKAACVGEKKWQEWMIRMRDPFTRRTEERFFHQEKIDEAWGWVLEG